LAKNTDIEWALIRYNSGSADKAILARDIQSNTASSESVSFEFAVNYVLDGHSEPNNWQIIDAGHSHPAGNEYHGPSGYDPRDIHTIRQDGDIQLAHIYQTLPAFPNMNFNFYIYDADSTNGGYYKYSSPANQPPQVSGPYSSYLNLPH
ncbi:MAG: hypothetical protein JWP37_1271, partial [Mucilaginibacter sp.]|nr:hypothetical protein [Mucilaginibacter sp.]